MDVEETIDVSELAALEQRVRNERTMLFADFVDGCVTVTLCIHLSCDLRTMLPAPKVRLQSLTQINTFEQVHDAANLLALMRSAMLRVSTLLESYAYAEADFGAPPA